MPVKHIVLFAFNTGAPVDDIVAAFTQLATIELNDIVTAYECGTNISLEGLDKGLTHSFVLSFANVADRDAYLPHSKHADFVDQWVKQPMDSSKLPYVKDVCVFDYEV